MKLYFAGRSSSWQDIRTWIERAEQCGHEVTHDWTVDVEQHGPDFTGSLGILMRAAENDLRGVEECDIFVLFPEEGIYGAMTELGVALARNRGVWLVGEPKRNSIFFLDSNVEAISKEQLASRLVANG